MILYWVCKEISCMKHKPREDSEDVLGASRRYNGSKGEDKIREEQNN